MRWCAAAHCTVNNRLQQLQCSFKKCAHLLLVCSSCKQHLRVGSSTDTPVHLFRRVSCVLIRVDTACWLTLHRASTRSGQEGIGRHARTCESRIPAAGSRCVCSPDSSKDFTSRHCCGCDTLQASCTRHPFLRHMQQQTCFYFIIRPQQYPDVELLTNAWPSLGSVPVWSSAATSSSRSNALLHALPAATMWLKA